VLHEAFVSIIGTVYEMIVMKLSIKDCDSMIVFIFKYPRAVVFKQEIGLEVKKGKR
jgi:hypothetical protein